jgi:hypothetical protein
MVLLKDERNFSISRTERKARLRGLDHLGEVAPREGEKKAVLTKRFVELKFPRLFTTDIEP